MDPKVVAAIITAAGTIAAGLITARGRSRPEPAPPPAAQHFTFIQTVDQSAYGYGAPSQPTTQQPPEHGRSGRLSVLFVMLVVAVILWLVTTALLPDSTVGAGPSTPGGTAELSRSAGASSSDNVTPSTAPSTTPSATATSTEYSSAAPTVSETATASQVKRAAQEVINNYNNYVKATGASRDSSGFHKYFTSQVQWYNQGPISSSTVLHKFWGPPGHKSYTIYQPAQVVRICSLDDNEVELDSVVHYRSLHESKWLSDPTMYTFRRDPSTGALRVSGMREASAQGC